MDAEHPRAAGFRQASLPERFLLHRQRVSPIVQGFPRNRCFASAPPPLPNTFDPARIGKSPRQRHTKSDANVEAVLERVLGMRIREQMNGRYRE